MSPTTYRAAPPRGDSCSLPWRRGAVSAARAPRGAGPTRASDLVGLDLARQHVERLKEEVRPPDELVARGEVAALAVTAAVEDAAGVQVAFGEHARRRLGGAAVLAALLVLEGGGDLQESRGDDGRRRGVVLGVGGDGGVEVPEGDAARRDVGKPPVGRLQRDGEELLLARPLVHDGVSQDAPRLRARPRALVGEPLVGVAARERARRPVERVRLGDAADGAHAELDPPPPVRAAQLLPRGLGGRLRGPDEERRALDGVDGRLALADVAPLLGRGAEREAAGAPLVPPR